jgi:uncharacterized cupredoxin-like copper-binding protein
MMRRAWTVAATTVVLAVMSVGLFLPSGTASPSTEAATTRVSVKMSEFKFALSKKRIPTGTAIFGVSNIGHSSHDFKIKGKKTRVLIHGESQPLRVTFAKKGRYVFVCTLPGHAAAGMKGTLTVTAPAS